MKMIQGIVLLCFFFDTGLVINSKFNSVFCFNSPKIVHICF